MPVVGFLYPGAAEPNINLVAAFRKGLSEIGYVEGKNVAVEFRWANNQLDRLPELADDLVHRRVAVIALGGAVTAVKVAKAATSTIPIVFAIGADPVEAGLVASLNRPGGNVTGINTVNGQLAAKWLGLLHELLPRATRFALLVNVGNRLTAESTIKDVQAAALTIGGQIEILQASTNRDIEMAFASVVQKRAEALLVAPDPLFLENRERLAGLAQQHSIPAIYAIRAYAEAGGLMSYGASYVDIFRQAGLYTGRILNGERPADLPVMQATKFEFVINLKTAKALGLEIPVTLLARADEVIE